MPAEAFRDLHLDGEYGIQGRERVLKDHGDLCAAQAAQPSFGQAQDIAAAKHHLSARDAGRRRQQADQRSDHRRLAAPRLADEPEHLAGADLERDTIGGAHASGKLDDQVAYVEQRLADLHVDGRGRQRFISGRR